MNEEVMAKRAAECGGCKDNREDVSSSISPALKNLQWNWDERRGDYYMELMGKNGNKIKYFYHSYDELFSCEHGIGSINCTECEFCIVLMERHNFRNEDELDYELFGEWNINDIAEEAVKEELKTYQINENTLFLDPCVQSPDLLGAVIKLYPNIMENQLYGIGLQRSFWAGWSDITNYDPLEDCANTFKKGNFQLGVAELDDYTAKSFWEKNFLKFANPENMDKDNPKNELSFIILPNKHELRYLKIKKLQEARADLDSLKLGMRNLELERNNLYERTQILEERVRFLGNEEWEKPSDA